MLLSDIAILYFKTKGETPVIELAYIWSVSCLCSIWAIINHLRQLTILKKVVSVIIHSIRVTYPFLFVIVFVYLIFALIGCSLFGGGVNSLTPDLYSQACGGELNEGYVYLNFNDMPSAVAMLYSLTLNNQMIVLINMTTVNAGKERDYRSIFYLVYVFLVNMMLFNIFVGMIIGIGLEYFNLILEQSEVDVIVDNIVVEPKKVKKVCIY